jgi:hypothetical protein
MTGLGRAAFEGAGLGGGGVCPHGRAGRATAVAGLRRPGWSGLGVAQPVSSSRALAALASHATAYGRP